MRMPAMAAMGAITATVFNPGLNPEAKYIHRSKSGSYNEIIHQLIVQGQTDAKNILFEFWLCHLLHQYIVHISYSENGSTY